MSDDPLGFGTDEDTPRKKIKRRNPPESAPPPQPTMDAAAEKAMKDIKADELRAEIDALNSKLAACRRQLLVYES